MDIVIKSFNRPYYLERCLRSIYKYANGDFNIIILDDGTPLQYLDRIKDLFPDVEIKKSPLYEKKSQSLLDHIANVKRYDESVIPIAFWIREISACSDYFLLLEDDIWLSEPVSLQDLQQIMKSENIVMTKLNWLGNPVLITGKKHQLTSEIEEIVPYIPILSSGIFMNKYRIRSLLYHLGIMKMIKSEFKYQLPYYTLYAVAAACFNKEYWLSLWSEKQSNVQEHLQLQKAAEWFNSNKSRYAKTKIEITRTSFITSATNMYDGINLDVFRLNYHLNEAWLKGELNSMQNFPADFEESYFKIILEKANDKDATYLEWIKWVSRFKSQYRDIGCQVD